MKTTSQAILFIAVLFHGCLLWQMTSALPNTSEFDRWLATYDFQEGRSDGTLCTGQLDGFYSFNNQQCNSNYYACSGGAQYNLTCKSPLVFDPTSKTCAISCSIVPPPTQPTTQAPFTCVKDGNYAFGECISEYYACIDQVLYPQRCPGGGVFDSVCKQCRSSSCCTPGATICQSCSATGTTTPSATISPVTNPTTATALVPDSTTTSTTATTTTIAPVTTVPTFPPPPTDPFVCPDYGVFAIPDYCGPWYYACTGAGAGAVLLQCEQPAGKIIYYDCLKKECVLKDSATCEDIGTNACPPE